LSTNTILASAPLTATGYHLKATGTTLGQSLIWDNGTNVGIGNTNTSYTLDVSGTLRNTTSAYFATTSGSVGIGTSTPLTNTHIAGTNGITDSFGQLLVSTTNTATIDFGGQITLGGFYNGTTNQTAFGAIAGRKENATANNALGYLSFSTQNGTITERMRITSAGNVGIGTDSPTALGTYYTTLQLKGKSGGTGNEGGYLLTTDADGTTTGQFGTDGNFVYFGSRSNTDAVVTTNNTERMRITSAGKVNIGTTTNNGVMVFPRTSENIALSTYDNNTLQLSTLLANTGNLRIEGSLSKGSGSFRIDHPLESLSNTHDLVHSFVEAPQADLYYRGKLILVNGKAQANIDEVSSMTEGTFEALCREVQCFTTNESGWDLIKGKVIGNIIYIESQNTNSTDEISWMVIGERKDKHMMDTEWTDENGKVIVEPLKRIEPIESTISSKRRTI
jgi:hypothetical protein